MTHELMVPSLSPSHIRSSLVPWKVVEQGDLEIRDANSPELETTGDVIVKVAHFVIPQMLAELFGFLELLDRVLRPLQFAPKLISLELENLSI